jgi:hypothetical protein
MCVADVLGVFRGAGEPCMQQVLRAYRTAYTPGDLPGVLSGLVVRHRVLPTHLLSHGCVNAYPLLIDGCGLVPPTSVVEVFFTGDKVHLTVFRVKGA